jgi:hypothetical protein
MRPSPEEGRIDRKRKAKKGQGDRGDRPRKKSR